YQQLSIHNRKEVNMNGKVLMEVLDQPSGPWIKHALREIECAIVLKKVKNSRTDIVEWVKQNVKV
ncbi:CCA tRNA nucleotidyltransferase, partial [Staphylococcus chromogenes]